MAKSKKMSEQHLLMIPWVAYGHFIPFLHLSNKLAERGHRVSFMLPKSAHLKLESLNQFPSLIHFFPLVIPHVDGLPYGAETASDVPSHLEKHLITAFDQTRDQIQSYIISLLPNFVLYDFAYWVPSLNIGDFKCISYSVVNTVIRAFCLVPSRKINIETATAEEFMEPPPGFPSFKIQLNPEEASLALAFFKVYEGGLSFYERIARSIRDSDALAFRTCQEIEGSFCDYLANQFAKPVLLTGLALPETPVTELEEKWANWLNKFEVGSVVYCALGSQVVLDKDQFQEFVLGFELTGLPFLLALKPPHGYAAVEEALPEGFNERVVERGWVYGGWVPQPLILKHPSTGCFVSHCGYGSMWESLLSDCQIVLIPHQVDHIFGTKLMVQELEIAVEVERGKNRWIAKESLCNAIKLAMDKDNLVAAGIRSNHNKLRNALSSNMQENYIDCFIQSLNDILESQPQK